MNKEKFIDLLDDEAKHAEKAEGLRLNEVMMGEVYKINTKNTEYLLECRKDGFYLSANNKDYLTTPKKVKIGGSTWGGSTIMPGFVGINMRLEITISIEGKENLLTTTPVQRIEKVGNNTIH